jgi:sugar transferase EpsL
MPRAARTRLSKRVLDVAVSAAALVLGAPGLAVIAGLIRATMGRPIFFRQVRPGQGGKAFTIYKFRTMSDVRDPDGRPAPDADRLTRLGRFLRATSLDELPEFVNILKGDMSLVGPRPLLPEYLPLYSAAQARRHEVRPGLTGWAQVNGRNALSWDEKLALDTWYVDNWSLLLDLRILWMTLVQAIRPRGIAHEGHATMPAFNNNERGSDA